MKFSYIRNELSINGKKIKFFDAPAKIYKVIMPEDNLAIFMINVYHDRDEDNKPEENRNIFAVNEKGKVVWQIEEVPDKYCRKDLNKNEIVKEIYTGIWIDEKGVLKVFIPMGFIFDVDIKTGKLSNPAFTK
jgi:hypothetical protein